MNPILSAAALGLMKRFLIPGPLPKGHPGALHTCLLGPLAEELQFRAVPVKAGLPAPLSSAAFAMAHFVGQKNIPTGGWAAFRFADVFTGGMIYSQAYKSMGYLGAVVAHSVHNLMCDVGRGGLLPPLAGAHNLRTPNRYVMVPRKKLRK